MSAWSRKRQFGPIRGYVFANRCNSFGCLGIGASYTSKHFEAFVTNFPPQQKIRNQSPRFK